MRLGDLLVQTGFISEEELAAALRNQSSAKKTPIGQHLKILNYLTEADLDLVLQAQRKMAFTSMSSELAISSLKYAKKHKVDFAAACRLVLNSVNQGPQPEADFNGRQTLRIPVSTRTAEMAKPGASPRFASNPVELIQQSDKAIAQENWDLAVKLLEEARTIFEMSDGHSDESVIPVYCRLAEIYSKRGQTSLVKERLNKLSNVLRNSSSQTPGALAVFANVAGLFFKQELYAEANQIYFSAIPKLAELLPFDQAQFNIILKDAIACSRLTEITEKRNLRIGELLTGSGLVKDEQFQDALQKSKRLRQPLGKVLTELGLLSTQDLRNAVKVQLMCRAAIFPAQYAPCAIKAASYSKDADDFFKKLNLPLDLPSAKHLPELIARMDRLLLKEASGGIKDPEVAIMAAEVAEICLLRNELAEAELMFRRAHAILEISSEKYKYNLANVCLKLGRLLIQQQKYPEAELLLMESMQTKNMILGDKHPEIAEVLMEIGYLYFSQGNYAPAIGFLRSSWTIQENSGEPEQKRYLLELLINSLEQIGMDSESDSYREKLREIRMNR